jgi:hypothetical protein
MSAIGILTYSVPPAAWTVILLILPILRAGLLQGESSSPFGRPSTAAWFAAALFGTVAVPASLWLSLVNRHVPEPYLVSGQHLEEGTMKTKDA